MAAATMNKTSPIAEFFARAFTPESYPRVKYVPGQASLCMFGPIDGAGMIHWRPVRRAPHRCKSIIDKYADLPGSEWAREILSGYWCSTLECTLGYEALTLDLGAWNEEAYHRKQDQLRDHFASQSHHGLPLSVPIGTSVSGSGCRYALRLSDCQLWLEDPYGRGLEKLNETFEGFFAMLQHQAVSEDMLHKVVFE